MVDLIFRLQVTVTAVCPLFPPLFYILLFIPSGALCHDTLPLLPVPFVYFLLTGKYVDYRNPLSIFIKSIDLLLFGSPATVLADRPGRCQGVAVGVPVPLVMDGEVDDHSILHKGSEEFLYHLDLQRPVKTFWQGDLKLPGKLGVGILLDLYDGIPEGLPVFIFFWGILTEQNLRVDDPSLLCEVVSDAQFFIIQLLPATVSGTGDSGLSFGPPVHLHRQMIDCHISHLLSVIIFVSSFLNILPDVCTRVY